MKIKIFIFSLVLFLFAGVELQVATAQTIYGPWQAGWGQQVTQGTPSAGDPKVVTQSGLTYLQHGNYRAAYEAFRQAAMLGYGEAQFHLGVMLYNGEGVPRNLIDAYAWYTLASQAGSQPAADYARDVAGMLSDQDRYLAQQRVQQLSSMIMAGRQTVPVPANQQTNAGKARGVPTHQLSPGYQSVDPHGRVLVVQYPLSSARAMMAKVLKDLGGFFDQRPTPIGAFSDDGDRDVQLAFMARRNGAPIRGVVFAQATPEDTGQATIIFDLADRFATNFEQLCRTYLPGGSSKGSPLPSERIQWQQVSYGQGTIRIPKDWLVTSTNAQGAVDAAGPDGSGVSLGIYYPVFTVLQGSYPLKAPYMGPVQAVKVLTPRILAQSNIMVNDLRILETTPAGWYTPVPGGQAALIVWESSITAGGRRLRYRCLSLVMTAPVDYSQWMYYFSTVQAPADRFDTMLPILMEIWYSWKIDNAVFRQRLQSAVQSLRTAHQIYQNAAANRSRTSSNVSAAWSHVVRGTWPLEDTNTNTRWVVPHDNIKQVIKGLNAKAGYNRYREIPLSELTR